MKLDTVKKFSHPPDFNPLAEHNAFWKCVQSAAFYLFVQFIKMLTIATCFPPVDESTSFVVKTEFLKNTVDLLDLVVAALGWGSAELIVTKFLPLWVGARGIDFDWKYIQMSLDSNIALVR
ncbi:unnamed protein product [Rotaria socialis]|uniref:BOS complex subunit TMEM147 n=1 Tax=Rotaria socialis TaxID=392032 RepID=A0A820S061_9BILA|nr:unnamed protein product [Rotaria socialis]CAF3428086.1 unnamed protein product [Rotaria socialis]CAF4450471.1 unnamed protein product [Rotaria socialis]CAF4532539.1 unnamed protein product [Rotaria socialis]